MQKKFELNFENKKKIIIIKLKETLLKEQEVWKVFYINITDLSKDHMMNT